MVLTVTRFTAQVHTFDNSQTDFTSYLFSGESAITGLQNVSDFPNWNYWMNEQVNKSRILVCVGRIEGLFFSFLRSV